MEIPDICYANSGMTVCSAALLWVSDSVGNVPRSNMFARRITMDVLIVEENISASSTLSSNLRIEAIRTGMARALDQFLAYVASQGALIEEDETK